MPGATVTATNQATNVPYTGTSNNAGAYVITGVPIGEYVVKVELQGFKSVQSAVSLSASQTARVDSSLDVGAVAETVEVVATSAVLQTENAVVGNTLQREQVEKLPIQGRNLSTATLYVAGVTTPNPSSVNSLKNTGGGRPYVNGPREQGNNFMLDGVDMNDAIDNLIAYQPSPDAVEQVSVETNNYSPELGNVVGAIVNMVVKSGTNQFAGNAFYYWRDNDLAATPWNTNRLGGEKSEFSRDIFGGTFGGAIVRDQLFFFADYQGGRQEVPPVNAFTTVAPDEWRRGDLSSLLASNIVLRDPVTGQPFPNNQIPVGRFGTVARNLFANEALYPRPNVARGLADFTGNYQGLSSSEEDTNQMDAKIDWNASQQDKLYFRYSWQDHEARTGQTAMPLLYGSLSTNPFWSAGANWNRIFGASIVNDLLIGFNNNEFNGEILDTHGTGAVNNQLGIGGAQPIPGLTFLNVGNGVAGFGSTAVTSNTANRVFQVNERLTWARGRHTLKFGASWNYYQMERYYSGNNGVLGRMDFDGSFTGAAFADFLLDQVAGKGRGSLSEPWTHLQHRTALYAADDFKITNALTLNIGLRWAYTSPLVEKDDRQANFDLTNAAHLIAAQNGNSRAVRALLQRVGAATRLRLPDGRPLGVPRRLWHHAVHGRHGCEPAAAAEPAVLLRVAGQLRPDERGRHDDDRLRGIAGARPALGAGSGLGPRAATAVHAAVERVCRVPARHAVVHQHRLRRQLVEVPGGANRRQPAAAGVGDPASWAPLQERRPLFQFNPLITNISTTASRGRGNYNALQTSFKQRFWNGLDFLANYTWSKAMTNNLGYYGSGGVANEGAYPMNSYDIEANYGPPFFDATHQFSLAGSYELPFGWNRQFGSDWNAALDAVAGGWSTSFAVTAHTGYPITVVDGVRRSLQGTRSSDRPGRIGSGEVDNPTLDRWIDLSAFREAPLGEFGDAGVGILRAPGYWNVDMSISKRFLTFGRQYLLFRGEMFNALNHPNFGPPERNIRSQNFGRITSTVGDARVVQLVVKYYF